MSWQLRVGAGALGLSIVLAATAQTRSEDQKPATPGPAKGTFEVKLTPITEDRKDGLVSGRMTADKTFQGDLVGTSKGEMWTADTSVQGSAGYVAIEKFTGALRGRSGTFALLHQGTMRRGGEFDLRIVVVPDSGTGDLKGLAGSMKIIIAEGKHSYEFDYTLPAAP